MLQRCPQCGGVLEVISRPAFLSLERRRSDIWDFADGLPVQRTDNYVTLGEGWTPLLPAPELAQALGVGELLLKVETTNPTGTFKDRGLAVATAYAKEHGVRVVIGVSTGNALHAQAAYAARASLVSLIVVPKTVPLSRLAQPLACGSRVAIVQGDCSVAHALAEKLTRLGECYNVSTNFANPIAPEGYKTVAYEIGTQMARIADWVVIPVGAGPLMAGCGRGFEDLVTTGVASRTPRLLAVQAEGCAPVTMAFQAGAQEVEAWEAPVSTVARGIADSLRGYAQDGTYSLSWVYRTRGHAVAVPDAAILEDVNTLARITGLYVEPTSAAVIAGLRTAVQQSVIDRDATVVCILSGTGFKECVDEESIAERVPVFPSDDLEAISDWFGINVR